MNFLKRDVVQGEGGENSGGPSDAKNPFENQKGQSVRGKQSDHAPRIPRKIDVLRALRGIQSIVMQHVRLKEKTAAGVQHEPVQAILEQVGVKKACPETSEDTGDGMREKVKRDPNKGSAGEGGGEEIVSLGF